MKLHTRRLAFGVLAAGALLTGCARKVELYHAFDLDRPQGVLTHHNVGFNSGDRFRLRVLPKQDCYIYVLHEGTDGGYSMLFPRGEVEGGNNFLLKDNEVVIPSAGWFRLDQQGGIEKIYLLACRKSIAEVESLRNRESLSAEEVKVVLKVVDEVYNGRTGRRETEISGIYERNQIKNHRRYPALDVAITLAHE